MRENNNICVKSATKKDLDKIEEIYLTSVKNNKEGFIQDTSYHGSIKDFVEVVQNESGAFLCIFCNKKLVGIGALKQINKKETEMCKLHVNGDYKGKGLGFKLSEALISKAKEKGYKKVILNVTKSQKEAIGLYKKLGFKKTRDKFYEIKHKEKLMTFDTVWMELPLVV